MFISPDGSSVSIPKALASYFWISYIEWENSKEKIHRTKVEDYSGGVLDAVEVEMVNDLIVNRVESDLTIHLSPVAEIFRNIAASKHPEVITFDDSLTVHELLMFVNTVYSFISSSLVGDFTVGEVQGDDFSTFDPDNIGPEDIVRYYSMMLIEELVDLWE